MRYLHTRRETSTRHISKPRRSLTLEPFLRPILRLQQVWGWVMQGSFTYPMCSSIQEIHSNIFGHYSSAVCVFIDHSER